MKVIYLTNKASGISWGYDMDGAWNAFLKLVNADQNFQQIMHYPVRKAVLSPYAIIPGREITEKSSPDIMAGRKSFLPDIISRPSSMWGPRDYFWCGCRWKWSLLTLVIQKLKLTNHMQNNNSWTKTWFTNNSQSSHFNSILVQDWKGEPGHED